MIKLQNGGVINLLSFKYYLLETKDVGATKSNLENGGYNSQIYSVYSILPQLDDYNGLKLIKHNIGKELAYKLLNHETKKVVFGVVIGKFNKSKYFQYPYNSITYISRLDDDRIPKNFVIDFIYNKLIQNSNLPLMSDKEQYLGGFILWKKLISRALDDGKFAYLIDNGTLIKLTKENKDDILEASYGKDDSFKLKRYVISKKSLEV